MTTQSGYENTPGYSKVEIDGKMTVKLALYKGRPIRNQPGEDEGSILFICLGGGNYLLQAKFLTPGGMWGKGHAVYDTHKNINNVDDITHSVKEWCNDLRRYAKIPDRRIDVMMNKLCKNINNNRSTINMILSRLHKGLPL